MCGIVGVVGGKVDAAVFDAAVERIRHRGPDDRGVECLSARFGEVWLGFRRLAILDLSARGHQPMFDAGRRLCIVFNGEIYNFKDLRRELEACGHRFVSETDTEVILYAYAQWGARCVERFIGMFAFALWDAVAERLVLARDRLGIKPLYYWHGGGRLAFGSEVKALIGAAGLDRRIDQQSVARFLTFLWVPDPDTLLEGIKQLEPGHVAVFDGRSLTIECYWDVPVGSEDTLGEEEACRKLDELLHDSVRKRLISDVPLGAFLSGGVDSSLIVALMREVGVRKLITQTVGYLPEDLRYDIAPDDVPFARRVRERFEEIDYHEILLHPDVASLLPRLVWHLDDPVADPAAISTYLICRAAKDSATVMLSGMGAEELFAGYPRHRAVGLAERYRRLPGWTRQGIRTAVGHLKGSRPGPFLHVKRNAKKFVRSADLPFEDRYLGYLSYYVPEELERLLTDSGPARDVYGRHRTLLARTEGQDPVARMTHLDLKLFLPNLNLAYTDRGSMAASVEVRVPIIDHRVVELVRRFPAALLIRGRRQKYVLKRLAERYLPRDVVWRTKTGFGAPIRAWLQKDLRPVIRDLLAPERIRARGILRPEEVWRIIEDLWAGREDNALRVWAFLSFELWCQTFVDRDGASPVTL
jgi:asparagine synthase (glutamine-hydrolysing)